MLQHARLTWLDQTAVAKHDTRAPKQVVEWTHSVLRVTSSDATDFLDITDRVQAVVSLAGIDTGLVNVQSMHTTVAVVVNEHEPMLLDDFEHLLGRTVPADGRYRHDDLSQRTVNLTPDERTNGHSHCRALLLAPAACLNVVDARLALGRWQRVFVVDLDGPRDRSVSVVVLGVRRDDAAASDEAAGLVRQRA